MPVGCDMFITLMMSRMSQSRRHFHRLAAVGLAVAAGLLQGCYLSDRLLVDPADAVHPLADGVYARQGDSQDRFRLTLQPDGRYAVERVAADGALEETHTVLVTPQGDGYLLAEARDDGFAYALARVQGADLYLAAPDCADPLDRNAAEDQGADLDLPDAAGACGFDSAAALDAALETFEGHADFGQPYRRISPAPGG